MELERHPGSHVLGYVWQRQWYQNKLAIVHYAPEVILSGVELRRSYGHRGKRSIKLLQMHC